MVTIMKFLFLCSIGPVQDFIATARRSRDFWFGSWMLSELSKAAARAIADSQGVDNLIFPAPEKRDDLENNTKITVSNRILAVISIPPKDLAKEVESAVVDRLFNFTNEVLEDLKEINRELSDRQTQDILEFYWSAAEFEEDQYLRAKDEVEALMKIRKNTRGFKQFIGEPVMKSSLDGSREGVIPEIAYPKRWEEEPIQVEKAQNLYRTYKIRGGERMSGIDLVKRLGGKEEAPEFHSTSHVAAKTFFKFIEESGGSEVKILKDIKNEYKKLGWEIDFADGSLLYESRIGDYLPITSLHEQMREKIQKVLEEHAGKKAKPGNYYALLVVDGDNMGMVIDNQKNQQRHRDLSKQLSYFSSRVQEIISDKRYDGVPVYSGGDDILAYLPKYSVLACADELEKTFSTLMKEGDFSFVSVDDEIKYPTLSAGIVIAHHLTPLAEVLRLARKSEQRAKRIKGKNGLVIAVKKRSGTLLTVEGKWPELSERLQTMIGFTSEDLISNAAAYDLAKLATEVSGTGLSQKAVNHEVIRILSRKRESQSGDLIGEDVRDAFHQWLIDKNIPLREISRELMVARMFGRLPVSPLQVVEQKEEAKYS